VNSELKALSTCTRRGDEMVLEKSEKTKLLRILIILVDLNQGRINVDVMAFL